MKFGQFFTALGIAFLIFSGVLMGENIYYETLSKVKDPFKKASTLNEIVSTKTTQSPYEIFSSSGEFFILFPNTKIDFSNNKREFLEGEMFFSSDFIPFPNVKSTSKSIGKPQRGQLSIKNLLINAPQSSILVRRYPEESSIQVYAFNHSIELFWEDLKNPFLVPPGMMVSINEKLLSNKTTSLYYSKLKKEFRLKPFQVSLFDTQKTGTPEEKIIYAVNKLSKKEKELIHYAQIVPETWFSIRPGNITGKIVNFIKASTFGLPEKKKDLFAFQRMVEPLVEAHYSAKENKKVPTENSVNRFKQTLNSYEWKALLKNTIFKTQWENFAISQYVWTNTLRPSDAAYIFMSLHKRENNSAFDSIDNEFSRFESLVANKKIDEAESIVKTLKRKAEKTNITKEHQYNLTKRRRVLKELLDSQDFLQTKEPFELYVVLIKKEVALNLENRELLDELTLEIAQEVLFFLHKFIKQDPDPTIADVLIEGYNQINDTIKSSSERTGRASLFEEEEEEIRSLIKIAGSSKLSNEDIESIKEEQAYEDEINKRLEQLQSTAQEESKPPIHDEETLKNFLNEIEIDTEKIEILTLKNGEYLNFREGKYLGNMVSGTFQVFGQVFKTIKVNESSRHYAQPKFLKGILNSLMETNPTEIPPQEEINTEEAIPQNSNKAILEKTFIRELFQKEGLSISKENIVILNKELTYFEAKEAILDGRNKVGFIYDTTTEEMSEITLLIGKKRFRFTEKSYQRREGVEAVRKKVEEVSKK